jgi:hypothetical protein
MKSSRKLQLLKTSWISIKLDCCPIDRTFTKLNSKLDSNPMGWIDGILQKESDTHKSFLILVP